MSNPDRDFLEAYSQAWNAHDADKIMSMMTDDCVFETGGGTTPHGTRFEGASIVRQRVEEVWQDIPDVEFLQARHFVDGDRGCSEWIFTGTRADGTTMKMAGCDLFTFKDGKIWIKSSYLKNVAP